MQALRIAQTKNISYTYPNTLCMEASFCTTWSDTTECDKKTNV